jgi:hypothetical protein
MRAPTHRCRARRGQLERFNLHILVCLVMYDSGWCPLSISCSRDTPLGVYQGLSTESQVQNLNLAVSELVSDDLTRISSEQLPNFQILSIIFCTSSSFQRTDRVVKIDLSYTSHQMSALYVPSSLEGGFKHVSSCLEGEICYFSLDIASPYHNTYL